MCYAPSLTIRRQWVSLYVGVAAACISPRFEGAGCIFDVRLRASYAVTPYWYLPIIIRQGSTGTSTFDLLPITLLLLPPDGKGSPHVIWPHLPLGILLEEERKKTQRPADVGFLVQYHEANAQPGERTRCTRRNPPQNDNILFLGGCIYPRVLRMSTSTTLVMICLQ